MFQCLFYLRDVDNVNSRFGDFGRLQTCTCAALALHMCSLAPHTRGELVLKLCKERRSKVSHSPRSGRRRLNSVWARGPCATRGLSLQSPSSLWQCFVTSGKRPRVDPGSHGLNQEGPRWWNCKRPGIWLWIGIDGGRSLRAFAAHM